MKIKDVVECSFENWYNKFRKVTPKSVILPLPEGFVSYLLSDGIVLPESEHVPRPAASGSDLSSDDESWDESSEVKIQAPKFDEFDQKIKEAIKELGGKVFPKLNWSSPRDATWIVLNNSCCCSTVSDIYLLLKSSDFIIHDITQPFVLCNDYDCDSSEASSFNEVPYFLILRKWIEVNPDTEFRCFVKRNDLIGISQRDTTMYSEYLVRHKDSIINDIMSFFVEHIQHRFQSASYVFDVVRRKKDDVYLLDFNPFGEVTDSLLFNWSELKSGSFTAGHNHLPEYRCINHNRGVQPRPFSYYAMPKDIVDISTGEDSFKFVDLLKLKIEDQKQESSDEEPVC